MVDFFQRFQDFKRVREIVRTLSKYGFDSILNSSSANIGQSWQEWLSLEGERGREFGVRLRKLFEELGPMYLKLGQILSTRLDMFGEEVIFELSKLQDSTLYVDYSEIELCMRREYGRGYGEIFAELDPEPLAAASIAQVHLATLRDGQKAVVKIKRPGIEKVIQRDLEILANFIRKLCRKFPSFEVYNIWGIFEEFARALRRELDFRREARNILRFSLNFPGRNGPIRIPEVYMDYCRENVLVLERLEGVKITEFNGSLRQRQILAMRGANAVFKQVFLDGLFHADPHPGNIFILDNLQIAFLDFGIIGRLDSNMQSDLRNLILAVVSQDTERLARIILKVCQGNLKSGQERVFRNDLIDIIDSFYGLPLKYIQFHQVVFQLFALMRRYRLQVPSEYTLVLKSLLTIERIAETLYPDFHLINALKVFLEKHFLKRGRKIEWGMIQKNMLEFGYWFSSLPQQLRNLAEMAESGQIKIDFQQKDLELLHKELESTGKRITSGLILCSLIIGSALIITSPHRTAYKILGYDALGTIGFLIASGFGIWIVISCLKK
ncbi:MAG: AarF/ABC1/UbiB kinase family protein [Planctomycetota bacterium]|nr:MAG: AarF/ABC1/UbiB kinase family protein [Planctomycetota bacterium]